MPSTESVKQTLSNTANKSARSINFAIRALTCIMGVITMLFSLSITFVHVTLSFAGLIIGFYMLVGGIIFFLIHKRNSSLFEKFPCLEHKYGEGAFYFFIGTLVFTVTGINDVLGVFLFITGTILVLRGIYLVYKNKSSENDDESQNPLVDSAENDESKLYPQLDSAFDPNEPQEQPTESKFSLDV